MNTTLQLQSCRHKVYLIHLASEYESIKEHFHKYCHLHQCVYNKSIHKVHCHLGTDKCRCLLLGLWCSSFHGPIQDSWGWLGLNKIYEGSLCYVLGSSRCFGSGIGSELVFVSGSLVYAFLFLYKSRSIQIYIQMQMQI